jgi:hypothetical protein
MTSQTPRANWLRERAEKCRAAARRRTADKERLLIVAEAYSRLAEEVAEAAELLELLVKKKRKRLVLKRRLKPRVQRDTDVTQQS